LVAPFSSSADTADPLESLLHISTTQQPIGRGLLGAIILMLKVALGFALQRGHAMAVRATGQLRPRAGHRLDTLLFRALPFWAAAEDLRMPLSLHAVTNRPATQSGDGDEALRTLDGPIDYAALANIDHWVRMSLARMILSGVFERHPKLQVGSIEQEVSWASHFIERLDYTYTQRPQSGGYRYREDLLPSDYFHRNVFIGFQEDELGIRLRDIIGVNSLTWGSDYPHQESTFPRSREILQEILEDCSETEKAKIAGGNAARVYHLD